LRAGAFARAVFRAPRRALAAFLAPALRADALAAPVLRAGVRRVFARRRALEALRADARPLRPARLFDAVRFCPFVERLRDEPPVFRFAVFLAMVLTPAQ
jgi:hypothetical protein